MAKKRRAPARKASGKKRKAPRTTARKAARKAAQKPRKSARRAARKSVAKVARRAAGRSRRGAGARRASRSSARPPAPRGAARATRPAATARPAAEGKGPSDWTVAQRVKLAEERDELRREIETETNQLAVTGTSHPREDADIAEEEREDVESAKTVELLQKRFREVEHALVRIASGTYGQCRDCKKLIPRERLLAIPSANRCAPCQTIFEEKASRGVPSSGKEPSASEEVESSPEDRFEDLGNL